MRQRPATHSPVRPLPDQIETAVRVLRDGGVVSVPTDTLYGLAASAVDESAVERLYRIKRRPRGVPLPILLADPADMREYGVDVPELAWSLAATFFPGPLTLVLRSAGNLPDAVTGGLSTVAVRVPGHWVPREVVRKLGAPITGTSANRSGTPGPTTADGVREQLGNDIDYVIDAGRCPGGVASTVLDVSGPTPLVLRQGAVSRQELEKACGTAVFVAG